MKTRFILPVLAAFYLLLSACDVVELVVYEKKVSALREGVASQNVSISNVTQKEASLDQQSFLNSIEIPEGGKIDSIYLSSISIEAKENEGNEVSEAKVSVFVKLNNGTQQLFIDNINVRIGEKQDIQSSSLNLTNLRTQLNELYTSSEISTEKEVEFVYLILEKPGLDLKWSIDLEIGLNAKITYCSMVPGESELPDC